MRSPYRISPPPRRYYGESVSKDLFFVNGPMMPTHSATMIMLPVLVFSFVVRRYLVSGLTGGAIKG